MRTKHSTYRLPPATLAQLDALARDMDLSRAAVLCTLIDQAARRRRLGLPGAEPAPGGRPPTRQDDGEV